MPHMGSGHGSELPEQFADLDHDHLQFDSNGLGGSDNTTEGGVDVEPLDDEGGLDHNEVAEIVGWKLQVDSIIEGTTNNGDYSLFPTELQARGAFGINLGREDLQPDRADSEEGTFGTGIVVDQSGDNGILTQFVQFGSVGFFDDGSSGDGTGPYGGGGSGHDTFRDETVYPVDMGVRGPVVDENDSLSFVYNINQEPADGTTDTSDLRVETTAFLDVFYNIMEIEGVRSDYAMP